MNHPKKTLVFGANSFSGQDFVDLLLDDPETSVIGVSRAPLRDELFIRSRTRDVGDRFRYEALDFNQHMDEIKQLLDVERPARIVNFAAQSEVAPSWLHPEHWFQTNCVALAELVNHLRGADYLQKYLHISSPEVYGTCVGTVTEDAVMNPSTPYAASKAAADFLLETYRRQFDFPVVTVRATNVYGARQQLFKIIPRSAIYIRSGRQIPLHGGGVAVKSYIHIRDVSRGELAVLERGDAGRIYHLSPDQGISVRQVVQTICDQLGVEFSDVVDVVDERPGQDAAYVIDSSLARESLQWRPEVGFAAGIQEVIDWVDRYWELIHQQPLEYQHRR